jgi:hypothetical protein
MNALRARLTPMLLAFFVLGAAILRADDPAAHFPEIAQVNRRLSRRGAALRRVLAALRRAHPRRAEARLEGRVQQDLQLSGLGQRHPVRAHGQRRDAERPVPRLQRAGDQYLDSTDFRRGVLQKYGVESLVQHPQAARAGRHTRHAGDSRAGAVPAIPSPAAAGAIAGRRHAGQVAFPAHRSPRSSGPSSRPTPTSSTRCRS